LRFHLAIVFFDIMKLINLFLLFIFFTMPGFSQRKASIGAFAGTSYYLGDINPNVHFYSPKLSAGLIYRYDINKFYSLRANAYYASLSGDDVNFPNIYHPGNRFIHPANFTTSLIDATAQFEFNFFPLTGNARKREITPYVSGGLGYSIILASETSDNLNLPNSASATNHLTLPFGIGVKMNVAKRVTAGFEWSFRKTANDKVDGLENDILRQRPLHNNDWYSFAGIFITYKFFNFAADCPVYE
jgi:hypothetical protein